MFENSDDHIWDYRNPYVWMEKVRKGLPPLIVSCALTGGLQGKEVNENLPETAEEQAEQAYEACKAGASIVHVHVRRPDKLWSVTSDPEDYRRVNGMIRERSSDVIINNTTGGGPDLTLEQRMASIYANPEMCSLNLGPSTIKALVPERKEPLPHPRQAYMINECFSNSYADIHRYAKAMKHQGVKAELEIYNPGMFWVLHDLINEGLLDVPYDVQFVMGFQTGSYPTPANLLALISELPERSMFTVIGIGIYQPAMTAMGIVLGGHVRVGMEDNVYYSRGRKLKSNGEAVERVVRMARDLNREIATPRQARQMLGISSKPSQY